MIRSAFSPLWLGRAGSPYTTDFAASSACLNAPGVDKSGSGAPARTATPIPVLARATRLSGLTTPSLSSRSIAGSDTMTASNTSPSLIFCVTTTGEATVRITLCPVSFPNSVASSLTACCTAPTLSTRMSAAPAMLATKVSVTATEAIRPKLRIVSSPRNCQMIIRPLASILHHAARPIPRARFAPRWHRADVWGGGVLCPPRHDCEISQPLHEHAARGVGALHRRISVPIHRLEPVDAAGPHPHQAPAAAARPLGAAARFHALQLRCAEISAARRGDRADILDALLCRGAVGTDAGRMGALAALDDDRRRFCRRVGGDPSGRCKFSAGGAAVALRRALLRALFHHHPALWRARIPTRRRCSIPTSSVRSPCCRSCRSSGLRRAIRS